LGLSLLSEPAADHTSHELLLQTLEVTELIVKVGEWCVGLGEKMGGKATLSGFHQLKHPLCPHLYIPAVISTGLYYGSYQPSPLQIIRTLFWNTCRQVKNSWAFSGITLQILIEIRIKENIEWKHFKFFFLLSALSLTTGIKS
jgi:hypothetical protein